MSIYKRAMELASLGFYIFPVVENKKTPLIKDYTSLATNDPNDLAKYWYDSVLGFEHYHNIGIATSKYKDGALLVVDVDNKKGKDGSKTMLELELKGLDFPKTLTQKTPTGGFHLIYKVKEAVKQGVDIFGKNSGLDTRSRGGYIVGAGSLIDGKPYLINKDPIAFAPAWLIDKCNEGIQKERKAKNKNVKKVSQSTAKKRAIEYLEIHAPESVKGSGGDQTAYAVISRLKDFGLEKKYCLDILMVNWFEGSGWSPDKLQIKIDNAYNYGQNKQGVDSPEHDFTPVENQEAIGPVERLNKEYAFIVLGGKSTILRKKKNQDIDFMTVQAFHDFLKASTIQTGNGRRKQLSELWFSSPKRPSYIGLGLYPNNDAPEEVYNLWRGFSCKPLAKNEKPTADMIEGVRLFKEHALENVCMNDGELFNWLMGYFAHLIQKAGEKPLTALVFKGRKGVGKNALIDLVGNLFKPHYKVISNKKRLINNFNSYFANLILMVLDEAFWSGDKQAEGILKDLITGNEHHIEYKGKETFSIKNLLRICVIGNEEWLVPASEDERRFAVFNVGMARQTDKPYFIKMKKLINKKGGNRLLLRELMDFDLESVDVNEAPDTIGLLEQKLESLNPIHSWWYSCLKEVTIFGQDFGEGWPESIGRAQLRDAYLIYAKQRGIRSWLPDASVFGRTFQKCLTSVRSTRSRDGGSRVYTYRLPDLQTCREQFEQFIRHKIEWEDEEEPSNVIDAVNLFS